MARTPMSSRSVAAVTGGVGTALYYATPDLVPSRTARGWVKAGLTALVFAASVPELAATWASAQEGSGPDGEPSTSEAFRSLPVTSRAALLGLGAVGAAGVLGGALWADRWAFRNGQRRAAAGRRLPHTGPALLYGVLAAGIWLLPDPPTTH